MIKIISFACAALAYTNVAGILSVPHPVTVPTDESHYNIEQVGPTFDRSAVAAASFGLVVVLPETAPAPDQSLVVLWYPGVRARTPALA